MSAGAEPDEINESIDDSIQINEISSSDNNSSMSSSNQSSSLLKRSANLKKTSDAVVDTERMVTRRLLSPTVRVTRSAGDKSMKSSSQTIKSKVVIIRKKSAPIVAGGRIHKENISILRKVPAKALMDSAIVTPIRTRATDTLQSSQLDKKTLGRRTLRSQNAMTKDAAKKNANQTADASPLMQVGRNVAPAKACPISTRATKSTANTASNTKSMTCKKTPKRLINSNSVQIAKSNHSSKLQKEAHTLQFKVVVAKKSIVERLNGDVRSTVITRRMRLQQ